MNKIKKISRLLLTVIIISVMVVPEMSCATKKKRGRYKKPSGSSRRKGGTPCMNWSQLNPARTIYFETAAKQAQNDNTLQELPSPQHINERM